MRYKQYFSTILCLILVVLLPACCGCLSCKKRRNKKEKTAQKTIVTSQAPTSNDSINKF